MYEALEGLAPPALWQHFGELSAIPRPSGGEKASMDYVRRTADAAGLPWREDSFGNVVVYAGGAGGPAVAVQAHLDMVCEREPGVAHDFTADPIRVRREGDKVFARGTTLGADNGIGAAAALALITDPGIEHGPLELVFTVQEETGLHGAMAFDPDLLSATMLINLDSEDPATLTVGCAGGSAVRISLALPAEPVPEGCVAHLIVVAGARGGHSGVDIHEHRASALKVLLEVIGSLPQQPVIATIHGGSAHNVISRDASATVLVPLEDEAIFSAAFNRASAEEMAQWRAEEPALSIEVNPAELPGEVFAASGAVRLLDLLNALPHGVLAMSEHFEGKVQTSANLARVDAGAGSARVLASMRSFSAARLGEVQAGIEKLAEQAGATVAVEMSYPGWEPDPGSRLAAMASQQFQEINGRLPSVEVLHAGLECGVLVAKRPGMEAISFGPLISGAHSPSEYTTVSSIESMWKLLTGLLGALRKL
ncbi:MAG: beta-Ala-His dipeptidase [Actinomycetota bacterium]